MKMETVLVDLTPEASVRLAQGLQVFIRGAGNQVAEKIRENLASSQPGGKTYRHRQASAVGQAPADPQGHLTTSILVSEGDLGVEVTVGAPYAAYLELGTSRMAPRPFVLPAALAAFESADPKIIEIL